MKSSMSIYTGFINKAVPKVLSQVDRDKHSKTFGSCDRNFWHLKTRDFSSAILQQTGLALQLLYELDFEGNICYNKSDVKEWAEATVYFWKKIQLKDGSLNEYYPNEHGFPPTAFSLYSSCETYKRLGMNDEELIRAFEKTGRYLIKHIEPKAYNQEIASITALYSLYTINNEEWVKEGLNKKLERILSLQSEEGWFSEYGGADIGYLSVSLDMLAEYYWMSKDERVVEPLHKVISFIKYFVHPDGTIGGEYGSRNTTYFLPNGLEVMAQLGNKDAAAIRDAILSKSCENYFFLDAVDDRYCSHYLLHSFLRAIQKEQECGYKDKADTKLPYQNNESCYFKDAGIWIYINNNIYIIAGLQKGGVLKLYIDGEEKFIDCGYRVNYGKGKVAAMNWQDPSYTILMDEGAVIKGNFNTVSLKVPSPILHFGLRVIAKTVGNKIIGFLKKKIILVDDHSDITFERRIKIDKDVLEISDNIQSSSNVCLESASNFSLRHVASGKFFSISDLVAKSNEKYDDIKSLLVTKHIDLKSGEIKVERN